MINLGLISLGCPKNKVDSELMLGIIENRSDIKLVEDLREAEIIIINTCGFIQDAKEEAIETIIEAGHLKEKAKCQGIIVTGCLPQRYRDEILNEMPEVDAILGTGNFTEISETINMVLAGKKVNRIGPPSLDYKADLPRKIVDSHFAYVKIAEGCSNNCTYCSIPKIRGPLKSRPMGDIITEVKNLGKAGVKEIILVAQDTTQYGIDIYGKSQLTELLRLLVEIESIEWIRILYSYPEHVDNDLIDLIAREEKICNYLDLPIQHASNRIRKMMNRRGKKEDLIEIIKMIRNKIPDITLRTSLIVGFPGETKKDFEELKEFVEEVRFDRLGVFQYSLEEDTPAAKFPHQVESKVKEERYHKLMQIQQGISLNLNQELIGRKLEVIIDEIEDETALGRTRYDAPEIDNQVYLPKAGLIKGDIVTCLIKDAFEYDLIGERIHESS